MRAIRCIAGLIAAGTVFLAADVCADDSPPDREYFFYKGRNYGSESIYGPLYVFLNRAYDVLQLRAARRNIFDQPYGKEGMNVIRNLADPVSAINADGPARFTREEILPFSYTSDTARWTPNYTLHLIGGGMTFTALREWYELHHVPIAPLWAAATVMGSALVNETIENKGIVGYNTDAIADIYFFDIGGIVLFSFPPVNRFFRHELILADWSLQPSFVFPSGDLHNNGNNFALKWPLPFYPKLRPFFYSGLGMLLGLSYKTGEYSFSAAAGARSYRIKNQAVESVRNVVEFAPSAGLFLDRNESLLASVVVSNVEDYFVQLNIYPNAFFETDPGFGLWAVVSREGKVIAGISVTRALGFGVGAGSL